MTDNGFADIRIAPVSPHPVCPEHPQPALPSVTPKLVLNISPELKPYIFTTPPNWADLVEAADRIRQKLGISRAAWIDCLPDNGTLPSGNRCCGDRRQRRDNTLAGRLPQGNDRPRRERRAARRAPPGHEEQSSTYLDQEAAALYRQGDEFGDNAALTDAIDRYRALLKHWTRERVPLQWAMTQNNLGNALLRLGERESGTARLEEAVAAI